MLEEKNVRKGFFEYDEFLRIREALPSYLYAAITFGYKYGWRSSEIINIQWSHVDKTIWSVRLETGESKNKAGRTVYLDDELKEIFKSLWEGRTHRKVLIHHVFL